MTDQISEANQLSAWTNPQTSDPTGLAPVARRILLYSDFAERGVRCSDFCFGVTNGARRREDWLAMESDDL
jgi:hypothetical protein